MSGAVRNIQRPASRTTCTPRPAYCRCNSASAPLTAPFNTLDAPTLQANLETIPVLTGNVFVFGLTGGPFNIVFKTAEDATLTIQDSANLGLSFSQGNIRVNAGAFAGFSVRGPASAVWCSINVALAT